MPESATLRLNLLLEYAVVDPIAAAQTVADLRDALYAAVQMATRATVAGTTVDGLLERRVELARETTAAVAARASAWGVEIKKLEIKDVDHAAWAMNSRSGSSSGADASARTASSGRFATKAVRVSAPRRRASTMLGA